MIRANTLLAVCFTNMDFKEQGKLRSAIQARPSKYFLGNRPGDRMKKGKAVV